MVFVRRCAFCPSARARRLLHSRQAAKSRQSDCLGWLASLRGAAGPKGNEPMNLEKYTERARGFVQSAQSLALREGHQQFTPEHLLKVLLDDEEGLAAGPDRPGGRQLARGADRRSSWRSPSCPRSQGSGAGQLYLAPTTARLFDNAEKIAQKAGDSLRHRRAPAARARDGEGHARRPRSWPTPASRRRPSTPRSRICARAAPPIRRPPKTPMTR